MKRFTGRTALALCVSLLLLIGGCGGQGGDGGTSQTLTSAADSETSYTAAAIALPDSFVRLNAVQLRDGDIIYLQGYTGEEETASTIYSLGLDGQTRWAYDLALGSESSIADLALYEDGILVLINEYEEDGGDEVYAGSSLLYLEDGGQEAAIGGEIALGQLSSEPKEILVDSARACLYLIAWDSLFALDHNGGLLFTLSSSGQLSYACFTAGGELAVLEYASDQVFIRTLDYDAQAWDSAYTAGDSYGKIFSGGEYDLYCTDSGSQTLYGLDMQSGEAVQLLQFFNLGIVSSVIDIFSLEDGGFLVAGLSGLTLVQPADSAGDTEVKTLTLATFDTEDTSYEVLRFNQSQSEYQIQIKDYSAYNTGDDNTGGLEQLGLDIASGDAPDLYDLRDIPISQYIGLGLLEDLYPYMDDDPDIDRADYVESLLSAMEIDGGLYCLMPHVCVLALAADPDVLDGNTELTFTEMLALADGQDPFGGDLTRYEFLQYAIAGDNSPFVDWAGKTAAFDSEEFQSVLALAKLLPEEAGESAAGTPLFYFSLIADIGTILYGGVTVGAISASGGSAAYVGLPGDEGGRYLLTPSTYSWGMSSMSENKDGAWAFIREYLLEEYQGTNALPLSESALAADKEDYQAWVEDGGVFWAMGPEGEIELTVTSGVYFEALEELAASANGLYEENAALMEIIMDEAGAYFAGDRTAEDAAKNIQSRASIYMAEQG